MTSPRWGIAKEAGGREQEAGGDHASVPPTSCSLPPAPCFLLPAIRAPVAPAETAYFSVRSKNAHTLFHESICSGESSRSRVVRFTRRLKVCPTLVGPGVGFT